MRMHHYRFWTINHAIVVRPSPAGVFIVLGVLQLFKKTTLRPDVFADTAADHAKEMIPVSGFPLRSKATFVIAREDSQAIGPGNLPAKNGGCLWIEKRSSKWAQPFRSLGGGVGIQKHTKVTPGQPHPHVHDAARIIF